MPWIILTVISLIFDVIQIIGNMANAGIQSDRQSVQISHVQENRPSIFAANPFSFNDQDSSKDTDHTVLIIDRNALTLIALQSILYQFGATSENAMNSEEAFECI